MTLLLLARFVAQYGGSCGVAVETAGRRMVLQLENRLRESLERLRLKDQASTAAAARNSAGNPNHLEAMLQQLLSAAQAQSSRLTKLETSCFSNPGVGMGLNSKIGSRFADGGGAGALEQEVTSREVALEGALAALLQARAALDQVLISSRQRYLPAGKISILPPTNFPSVLTCCFLGLCMHLSQHFSTLLHQTATSSFALTHLGHASRGRMKPPLSGLASRHPTTHHAACVCPKYLFPLPLSPGILSVSSSNLCFFIYAKTSLSVIIVQPELHVTPG